MGYFISHIGVVFGAACFVAIAAIAWWYLTEKNAELKRQRAKARRARIEADKSESENQSR